jgi:MoxR-like ATPase
MAEMEAMTVAEASAKIDVIIDNIEKVIHGKRTEIKRALAAILCGSHLLLEDVPGVGKTMLAKSIAITLGCVYKRIQFTPDLLPSDITGVSIYRQNTAEFEFMEGPVFANIVLADEINRASPKTQSALLECMEERQITIDGATRVMPQPFFVIATQNPIEYEGTYPLPESQLDRFLLKQSIGYPPREDERAVIMAQVAGNPLEELKPVTNAEELLQMINIVRKIHDSDASADYLQNVIEATRNHHDLYLGASPRGAIALFRAAQAMALINKKEFVLPDYVKEMAPYVLGHRVIVKPEARIGGSTANEIIGEILNQVPVDNS